ncbi:MAG: RsmE family RNA methyltransferase [Planctomycetia bacterium]|nr:RsmE family RNA methyltransferase [Planctomycetia bacterium]
MAYRYYTSMAVSERNLPCVVSLEGDEAHHLIHVMRVKKGEPIVLFNGSGKEFLGEVVDVGKKALSVEIQSAHVVDRESSVAITIASALPKGERQRGLVEKLVELGVRRFIPLESERSVAKGGDGAESRLKRVVIEASKQCGRARLMDVAPTTHTKELFRANFDVASALFQPVYREDSLCQVGLSAPPTTEVRAEIEKTAVKIIAHPGGQNVREFVGAMHILAAVGPEGGFSPEEVDFALASGWQAVDLGKRLLRTETACMFLAARLGE